MSSTSTVTVWYLRNDGKAKPSKVRITQDADMDMDDLRKAIGDDLGLSRVESQSLNLWKPNEELLDEPGNKARTAWDERKRAADYRLDAIATELHSRQAVGSALQLNTGKDIVHVIVQLPNELCERDEDADRIHASSTLVRIYEDCFIRVHRWRTFATSLLEVNAVTECSTSTPVPNFVTELENKLKDKPGLTPDARTVINFVKDTQCSDLFNACDNTSQGPSQGPTGEGQPWRDAEPLEAEHIACVFKRAWPSLWSGAKKLGGELNESIANAMFFVPLAIEIPGGSMIKSQLGHTKSPMTLITQLINAPTSEDGLRTYEPKSDFLLSKAGLPRLLVEVASKPAVGSSLDWPTPVFPDDLVRMLLQGAAIVRFANNHVDEFKQGKNFVLVVAYIYKTGDARRFLLFQKEKDRKVFYRTPDYTDLSRNTDRAQFALLLYNLVHVLRGGSEDADRKTSNDVSQYGQEVDKHRKQFGTMSFYSGDTRGTSRKRSRPTEGGSGGGGAADSIDGRIELKANGYEVELPFETLSNIFTVRQRSESGQELIAKKVRENSNELAILQFINAQQTKSEHVISLFASFCGHSGPWVILPKLNSVRSCLTTKPHRLRDSATRICWGLIEGLAYLHTFCIAHRDIKPDNLVVDEKFCLKIIDFDIAIRLKTEDEVVSDYCGTEGWLAPEVEDEWPTYSPIKADRWSCGNVILYLLDRLEREDEPLKRIAKELGADDPGKRPSLLEWREWKSAPPPTTVCGGSKVAFPNRKRTAKVDGDDAARMAKKPKHDIAKMPRRDIMKMPRRDMACLCSTAGVGAE